LDEGAGPGQIPWAEGTAEERLGKGRAFPKLRMLGITGAYVATLVLLEPLPSGPRVIAETAQICPLAAA
jgi:hypothetical protein